MTATPEWRQHQIHATESLQAVQRQRDAKQLTIEQNDALMRDAGAAISRAVAADDRPIGKRSA